MWKTLHRASSNDLNRTVIVGPGLSGNMLRIRMQEPHPVWGFVNGHAVYAIKDIQIAASVSQTVVHACDEAGQSADGSDKFSMVPVPEFNPSVARTARQAAALLAAAEEHLGNL